MRRKALVVGINKYSSCPLNACVNDANAMAKLFEKNEDGTPNFDVVTLNDIQTKKELTQAIKQCFAGDSDVALFYYSGHGYIDERGGYLATPDFYISDAGVSLHELLSIVNNSKCKEKIIILDSCYSGDMGKDKVLNADSSIINNGVTILTSSRDTETSADGTKHSLFTELLIEGLSGGAADVLGHVSPGGVYAFIDKALGEWGQRPVFKTNVTRFTSLRNVTPQVNRSVIASICEYFDDPTQKMLLDPSYEYTNDPDVKHEYVKPYAHPDNVGKMKNLQKLESVGLVVPVGTPHMYFAAMESKSCALTAIGKQYWRLVKEGRI